LWASHVSGHPFAGVAEASYENAPLQLLKWMMLWFAEIVPGTGASGGQPGLHWRSGLQPKTQDACALRVVAVTMQNAASAKSENNARFMMSVPFALFAHSGDTSSRTPNPEYPNDLNAQLAVRLLHAPSMPGGSPQFWGCAAAMPCHRGPQRRLCQRRASRLAKRRALAAWL
jgi:hypothetical protein